MTRTGKLPISEKTFQGMVIALANATGWRTYHTFDSRRSAAGYPDLTMVRGARLIMAELKSEMGFASAAQLAWLGALGAIDGVEVFLWKPDDLDEIAEILSPSRRSHEAEDCRREYLTG